MESLALGHVAMGEIKPDTYWMDKLQLWHSDLFTQYSSIIKNHDHLNVLFRLRYNRTPTEICALLMLGLYKWGDKVISSLQSDVNGYIFACLIDRPTKRTVLLMAQCGLCSGIHYIFKRHSTIVRASTELATQCIRSQNSAPVPLMCLLQYLNTHPWLYHSTIPILSLSHEGTDVFEYLIRYQPLVAESWLRQLPSEVNVSSNHVTAAIQCYYTRRGYEPMYAVIRDRAARLIRKDKHKTIVSLHTPCEED